MLARRRIMRLEVAGIRNKRDAIKSLINILIYMVNKNFLITENLSNSTWNTLERSKLPFSFELMM